MLAFFMCMVRGSWTEVYLESAHRWRSFVRSLFVWCAECVRGLSSIRRTSTKQLSVALRILQSWPRPQISPTAPTTQQSLLVLTSHSYNDRDSARMLRLLQAAILNIYTAATGYFTSLWNVGSSRLDFVDDWREFSDPVTVEDTYR